MFSFMFLGMEIFLSMAIGGAAYLLITGNGPLALISNNMINGMSNTSLLAIPFFILAGELMNVAGMTTRVLKFALFFIGKIKGGLAYACVFINVIYAGVSGSAPADCSAISPILLPAMKEEGYPEDFSAAINATAAVVGPIIPPSIPMVFLALITNLSVGRLFLGGFVPGLLMAGSMCVVIYFRVRRMTTLKVHVSKMSWKGFWAVLRESGLSLIAPLIIILGVLSGLVTVTEVSILGTAYVLFIGVFVYRKIKLKDILQSFKKVAVFSSTIMALFAVAGIFSYLIAVEGLSQKLVALITSYSLSKYVYLLFINILFLLLGMIMDAIPIMLIFGPSLLAIAIALGINPTHFGIVMVVNLMIGLLTPPVGGLLYIETKISHQPFEKVSKAVLPFLAGLIAVLILITYVPALVTFLPNLIFGIGG